MSGTKNLMHSIQEDVKNEISNITGELSSNNVKEGIQSLYPIANNITTRNEVVDYQTIASEWISLNPNVTSKITSLMQLSINKTKTLPSTDQNYIFSWTQTYQSVIQQISEKS